MEFDMNGIALEAIPKGNFLQLAASWRAREL
jgi:hypothetical protein